MDGCHCARRGAGSLTLIEHWNGTAWTQVPSPNPSGDNVLDGVAATSASNAWAVGFYSPSGPTLQALAFHRTRPQRTPAKIE